jgi:DNA processing protein
MDLLTAVAISLVPGSRLKTASVLQELRRGGFEITLDLLLDALRLAPEERRTAAAAALDAAPQALAAAEAGGITPVSWFDDSYPPLLACVPDPPPVIWTRGIAAVLCRPAVAIVGSRAATPYALQVGRRLAGELAERRIVVVSGLARGVDSAAHEGCLAAAGETVAVLGSGVDRVYPAEHAPLSRRISDKGIVISELPPGTPPLQGNFPLRNRIISGISLGTVVVEASESSGSLITAACALRQGRDVMAVPGSILSGRNIGSHGLLKDGAKVVETADDILEELGWAQPTPQRRRGNVTKDPLLAKLQSGETYGFDQLLEVSGLPPAKLLTRLMELELLGQIQAAPGGRFVRSA